ncbi:outer membrane protein [Pseudazoarcus pumilus]|nr:outer membrane beta-barrel protein [Pseudazoarcus pumilus]
MKVSRRFPVFCGAVLALAASAPSMAADGAYVRLGVAAEWSRDAHFRDRDCAATAPPALFGCGAGRDGRTLGARGDFGDGHAFDVAVGRRFSPMLRGELLLTHRRGFDFDGQANFLNVAGPQPVGGSLRSTALFAAGYVDLAPIGRVQPFVGAGVGLARNRVGSMRYGFPGLGANASTTVSGGSHTGFAWMAAAGVNVALDAGWSVDVAWRYTDLGRVRSDHGDATIVRSSGSFDLDIAGTRARLRTHGLSLGLRRSF